MSAIDPISAVHHGVEALLRPYFVKAKWTIQPVPSPLTLKEFHSLVRATPWIGIAWASYDPRPGNTRLLDGLQHLRLTVCVRNQDKTARLFGDRLGPGLYPSLTTAAMAVHGATLGDLGSIRVSRVAQSFAEGYDDDQVALGIVELEMGTAWGDVLGEFASAPAFARLVSAFELVAGDGTTRPIATDTTDIPQDEDA